MSRIRVKFTPETPEQMDKRRHRRRMYRSVIALLIIHLLLLTFFVLKHYELLPEFEGNSGAGVEVPVKPKPPVVKKPPKPEILTNQAPIFKTGHSVQDADRGPNPKTIDLLRTSLSETEGMMGIDVSHWQETIDWSQPLLSESDQKIDFVIVKATQGDHYIDSQFENNWNGAKGAGKTIGAYHFYIYKDDPEYQANHFVSTVDFSQGMIRPIVDLELDCSECTTPGISKEALVANVKKFLEIVEEKTKTKPIIYSYESFYNTYLREAFSEYDVWIAKYSSVKPLGFPLYADQIGGEDPRYLMWQFTDQEKLKDWKTNVDASYIPDRYLEDVKIH